MNTSVDFPIETDIDGHKIVIQSANMLVHEEINIRCKSGEEYFRAYVLGFVSGESGNKQIIIRNYRNQNITIDLCDVFRIVKLITLKEAYDNYDKALQKITPLIGKNINFIWMEKKFSNVKVVRIFCDKIFDELFKRDGKNKKITIQNDSGKKHSFDLFHVVSVEEC